MFSETPSVRSDTKKPSPFPQKTPHPQTQLSPRKKTHKYPITSSKRKRFTHTGRENSHRLPTDPPKRKAAPIW